MTREMWDNIEKLSELRSAYSCFDEEEQPYYHALSLGIEGIKALEQEPCEDCISRQAVEKITWEEPSYTDPFNVLTEVREKVRALPPVTPQPKTGWIPVSERPPETDDEVIAYDGADAFVAWYGVNGWHSTDNRFDPRVPIIEWKPINLPKAEEKTNDSCWKEYYESKFMKKV